MNKSPLFAEKTYPGVVKCPCGDATCKQWFAHNVGASGRMSLELALRVSAVDELYDALDHAVLACDSAHPMDTDFSWIFAAKAALAKARGEQ